MLINDGEVPSSVMALGLAGSGQQWPDHFVAQYQQGRQRAHPVWGGLVAPRVFDPADQLLGSELFQVIGGPASGSVLSWPDRLSAQLAVFDFFVKQGILSR